MILKHCQVTAVPVQLAVRQAALGTEKCEYHIQTLLQLFNSAFVAGKQPQTNIKE